MRLAGKKAIVTGAASGIGRATALRFAAEGAAVACVDLDTSALASLAQEIERDGGQAIALTADVCNDDAVRTCVADALAALGRIDILLNNAGITILGGVAELSDAEWNREIDTNLTSIYRVSKAAWPHLENGGGGAILNTASIAGLVGIAQDAAYATSKAGVVMLTRCMALDGAAAGIRVNCICPGYVETPMFRDFLEQTPNPAEMYQTAVARTPLQRVGTPADVASGFVYLASDEAAWITGTALVIDGGLTAGLPPL